MRRSPFLSRTSGIALQSRSKWRDAARAATIPLTARLRDTLAIESFGGIEALQALSMTGREHDADVIGLAFACSEIFAPVRYQSVDVAITPDGPMLIEINTGGAFDLAQLANGRGFLTDEVQEFFRECGVRPWAPKTRRRS